VASLKEGSTGMMLPHRVVSVLPRLASIGLSKNWHVENVMKGRIKSGLINYASTPLFEGSKKYAYGGYAYV
jgi:hypothetical protein